MDRAQIGGLDDVGIGALFGLYDYRLVSSSYSYSPIHNHVTHTKYIDGQSNETSLPI